MAGMKKPTVPRKKKISLATVGQVDTVFETMSKNTKSKWLYTRNGPQLWDGGMLQFK